MEWIKKNKKNIILCLIFLLGFVVRLVAINQYPQGLNVDEASAGYEAYSILNYAMDRNGNRLPVFLVAWGSGQNALYSYILIPFVKILGLSIFSTRLPMALIGCISLIIMYKMLKNIADEKTAIIGTAFFAICPWHIMKSRWGLESNLFPDIILLSVYTLIYALKNNKNYLIYLSFVIAGISAYAYGTSYFFLPIFIIPMLIYLIRKKEITIKQAIISLGVVFIISLPIIIFVVINKFDLPQINLPFATIPRIYENRFEELSSIFSGNFIKNSFINFIYSIKMLLTQSDGLPWNSIQGYGIIYSFSILFVIIGIYQSFKKKKVHDMIINFWFISAFLLLFVCEPNINRCNIIIIPMIYYAIIGICEVIEKIKFSEAIIIVIYLAEFVLFSYEYINMDYSQYSTFQDNIEEVIDYVEEAKVDNIYMEYSFKEPYIYVLFYAKKDANEFINTVEYFNQERYGFDNVKAFGKYKFYLPEDIDENEKAAYIVPINEEINIENEEFTITEFTEFKVIEKVEE